MSLRVTEYRPAIDRILAHYELPPQTLELVPSVFDWCEANGISEYSGSRPAICILKWEKTGKFHIVMCETLSEMAFEGINKVMRMHGYGEEIEKMLTSEKLRLLHLLLHEIACHVLKTTEQSQRDAWAFEEMAKHEI